MIRKILGVIAGVAVGTAIIFALEHVSGRLYPMPPRLDLRDRAAMQAWIAGLPIVSFLFVLAAYAIGSLAGGAVATLAAGRRTLRAGLAVGMVLTAAGVLNLVDIPQPLWFAVVSTALYLPCAVLGSRLLVRAA